MSYYGKKKVLHTLWFPFAVKLVSAISNTSIVVLFRCFVYYDCFDYLGLVEWRGWGFSTWVFEEFLIYYVLSLARQLHQGTIIQQHVLAQLEEITKLVDIFYLYAHLFYLIISFSFRRPSPSCPADRQLLSREKVFINPWTIFLLISWVTNYSLILARNFSVNL